MARFSEKARPKGIKVDQDKLVKQVLDDLKDDEEALTDWKAEAEEGWHNYYSQVTEEVKEFPWQGCSNFFVPATAIMCDALMAMMFSRFHLPKPFLSIKPTTEDMVDRAKKVDHLLNFQFREELKIPYEIDGWALDTLVEGVKVIMPHWSVDKKIIRHPRTISVPVQIQNPSTGEFITQMEEREIFDETEDRIEAPAITVPDSEDFLYPPILKDLQSCSHVIRIVYKTWEDILEGKEDGLYYNVNDDLEDALMENFLENKTIQEIKSGRIGVEQALDRKVIKIIEWYGRWDMGKGRRNEEVFV
ncbi:MAG: hypothetical protein QMD05_08965, partial [Candidatus Brocadiaceae bacterium]|nr:hypothetical protein [Candidatus Brocadiaceae bacterium]